MLARQTFGGILLALMALPALSTVDLPEFDFLSQVFQDLPFKSAAAAEQQARFLSQIDNDELEAAIETIAALRARLEADPGETYLRLARTTINHGLLLANAGEIDPAIDVLTQAIKLIRENYGRFHQDLYRPYFARAVLKASKSFEESTQDLRRAQHIIHRHGGVFAPDQIEAMRYLARLHENIGSHRKSDIDYRFMVQVSERSHGPDSVDLVPMLAEAAGYFARRGGMIPLPRIQAGSLGGGQEYEIYIRDTIFDESQSYFDRAIRIVEEHHGKDDLRLVPLLEGVADMRVRQRIGTGVGKRALERAVAIIDNNVSSDSGDIATALIRLGDIYTVTSDTRAARNYLRAWETLSSGDESMHAMRGRLFGFPTQLATSSETIPTLQRLPDDTTSGDQFYVEITYSVREDGRVVNIKIQDSNVPLKYRRHVRSRLESARFRPRMVDGELVATDGLSLRQNFNLTKRVTVPSAGPDDAAAPAS